MKPTPDLTVDIAGLRLKNPVMTASGTFGYGGEFRDYVDLGRLGAIVVKGLSLEPAKGNPPPRIVETPCGMLNAIGLENIGIEAFLQTRLKFLMRFDTPVVVNLYGTTVEAYEALAERVDGETAVAAVELNISCPNVKAGGIAFGVDPEAVTRLVGRVRRKTAKPLFVKLSPNVTDITAIALAAEAGGADALSLINTITGMAVDIETRRPCIANVTGGLSGPAIRPVALRMVWQVTRCVGIPVIGIGGITTAEDALAFLITGARAVQIGTANFVNPRATMEVIDGIANWLQARGVASVSEIVGTLELP